ncbi:hypothetical protein H8K52_18070 [Undibacterium seohonense]|uniref:Uncharacterized protein n=1 Tax=Undibacterium seohonense TaxID=1344950 RepID=A0ABR6X8W7_9BURK|nr:hypothetical protein [Undibacterium seohonense]MBC3809250.1 hypothetical protein [Undibacterium seohonense]
MKQTGFIEYKKALVSVLLILGVISTSFAEVQLTLKNSFIKKYKNRATISASCVVDHSKGKANSPSKDGDMHIAVRCPKEIALPLVAEFMNAREHKELLLETVNFAESGSSVQMSGAWRIWNEHGGDSSDFVQGNPVVKAIDTNPDHVFEIHPITQFNGTSVLDTLHPIDGYDAKDSTNAFRMYEASRSFIESIGTRTRITTSGVGYNYVKFQMKLNERPFPVEDGSFAFAKIQDWEGDLILRKREIVFES